MSGKESNLPFGSQLVNDKHYKLENPPLGSWKVIIDTNPNILKKQKGTCFKNWLKRNIGSEITYLMMSIPLREKHQVDPLKPV